MLILNHVVGFYEDWGARIMRGHAGGSLDDDLGFADRIFQVSLATVGLRRHPSPPHHHWSGFLASPSQALFPIPPNYNSPL